MKLKITMNEYERANCTLEVSQDLKSVEAYGYNWFKYIHTDKAGNIIESEYSSMTSRTHSCEMDSVLRRLNLNVGITLNFVNYYSDSFGRSVRNVHDRLYEGFNLKDPRHAINSEIEYIRIHIRAIIDKIKERGTHKKKNKERKEEIRELLFKIKDLRNFRDNYLDKKLWKKEKLKPIEKSEVEGFETYEELTLFRSYFQKPNGKLNEHAYRRALHYKSARWSYSVPTREQAQKLKDLLGISWEKLSEVIHYDFFSDTCNMIPPVDSVQYTQLKRWLKQREITKEGFNLLQIDKIHEYFINKLNRKTHNPREATPFPVKEELLKIESDDLRVIKNDYELRKEGRTQNHCIGGKHYINQCFKGYQALNFKGYTFFLEPNLKIRQTNGYRNSYTPMAVRNELEKLIEGVSA